MMKLFRTLVLIVSLTVCVITESSPQYGKKIPSLSSSNEEKGLKIPGKTRKNPEGKGYRTFHHPVTPPPPPVTPPPVYPPIVQHPTWIFPYCR